MNKIKWKNFGRAKVATAPQGLSGLTFAVEAGKGELFPTLAAGEHFYGTFTNKNKTTFEVVKIIGRSNDVFTIEAGGRGLDSTGAQQWYVNDYFYYGFSAAALNETFTDALIAFAALTGDVRKIPYFVNNTQMALADVWPYGLGVLNTPDSAAARTYLNAADATAFAALQDLAGRLMNSPSDTSFGFLSEKIVVGDNINITTETDVSGAQTLKISALPGVLPGTIIDFAGPTAPQGYLACPFVPTNISRAAYADLFAAIGTTWGSGDGSTTFGMPYFPTDYAAVQTNGDVGSATVGQVILHNHPNSGYVGGRVSAGYPGFDGSGDAVTLGPSGYTGGPANLAAGIRVLKCVKL